MLLTTTLLQHKTYMFVIEHGDYYKSFELQHCVKMI